MQQKQGTTYFKISASISRCPPSSCNQYLFPASLFVSDLMELVWEQTAREEPWRLLEASCSAQTSTLGFSSQCLRLNSWLYFHKILEISVT